MLKRLTKLFHRKQSYLPLGVVDWAVLISGLAVFATISLWTITNSSIWFDEAYGAYLIRFDFWEIAKYTAADVHPPVYYWLLKLWSMIFGNSEFALRSMSVLFGAIAIFFAFLLAKRMFGRGAAWISLMFMILAPMFIRYSQEMRMYTLVAAIVFAATYVLSIAVESKKRKHWVIYGLLVSLGMWTHYFAALVWLSHWVWRGLVIKINTKKSMGYVKEFFSKDWIVAHVLAVGLFVPWLPALLHQIRQVNAHGFWIPPVSINTIPNFFTNVFFYQDYDVVGSWLNLVLLAILIIMAVISLRVYRRLNAQMRSDYLLVAAVAFVPIILLFVFSLPPFRSSFIERYLIPSTLGISLFIGVTLALHEWLTKKLFAKIIGTVIIGLFIFGICNVVQLGNYNKNLYRSNNTRQLIQEVFAKSQPGQPVIADSPWMFYEAVFYATADHPVYFIDSNTQYTYGSFDMLEYNDNYKIKDLDEFVRQHHVVWYVGRPENNDLHSPYDDWRGIQQFRVDDSVHHTPAYQAIQYVYVGRE